VRNAVPNYRQQTSDLAAKVLIFRRRLPEYRVLKNPESFHPNLIPFLNCKEK
jgi:hypothetical protein